MSIIQTALGTDYFWISKFVRTSEVMDLGEGHDLDI